MKRFLIISVLFLSGCVHQVNAPLPSGAINQLDATTNSLLQTAHAFAARVSSAVQSTDPNIHIELSATQKGLLNALNRSLNIADPLEQAYHASGAPSSASALQSAANDVKSKLTAAQSGIGVQ